MSDRQALIEAIREHPGEDTPRLALADWFEENGDAARGEFIRVQCELARLDPASARYPELHLRQLQLLAEHERDWLGEWADRLVRWEFRRGMLEDVTVQPEPYCAAGAELFREHPIWRIAFVDGDGESLAPKAIRDVLSQPHTRHVRAIDAAGCKPGEYAVAMFGGQIHTNAWLAELARATALTNLRELSLFGGTRGGREDIGRHEWKAFCRAEHLCGLTHLDLSNWYDHGDGRAWVEDFRVLTGATFASGLRSLRLEHCSAGADAIAHLARSRCFTRLESLTVGTGTHHTAGSLIPPELLDAGVFPALRALTIPYGQHLAALADHPGWARLERVGLDGIDNHMERDPSTHAPVWRAFLRSPHLRPAAFSVRDAGYYDLVAAGFWDELAGAPWFGGLRELEIGLYNQSCAPFFDRELEGFPRLTSLSLNPSTELVERLAEWPGLANLTSLELNDGHHATDAEATAKLLTSPHLAPRLSRLGLNGLCRSREAVAALANCPALAGLQHLDFAFNELIPGSAEQLAASPHLRNLRSLHTWSEWEGEANDGGPAAAWLVLAHPQAFPQLRDVVLGSASSEEVQNEIRRRFGPRLRVFADC